MKQKKILSINIDGVIRNLFDQFDTVYRKKFIRNKGLVRMNENFEYAGDESNEDEEKALEAKINSLIHLPITTYDLKNHYEFNKDYTFEKFLYNDFCLEIFGSASQFPFAMEAANKINGVKKDLGLSDVILYCPGTNQSVTATYHFLTKNGCKLEHIIFKEEPLDIWQNSDLVITDNPNIIDQKPENKLCIKIRKEYNQNSNADFEFDTMKQITPEEIEKILNS